MTLEFARPLVLTLALSLCGSAWAKDRQLSDEMRLAVTASALSAEQLDRPVVGPGEALPDSQQARIATVVRDGPMLGLEGKAPPPVEEPEPAVTEPVTEPMIVDTDLGTAVPMSEVEEEEEVVAPAAPAPMPTDWMRMGPNEFGGATGLLLASSIDNLTRSIDEQRMMTMVEARLSDKQRLIDGLEADLLRATGRGPLIGSQEAMAAQLGPPAPETAAVAPTSQAAVAPKPPAATPAATTTPPKPATTPSSTTTPAPAMTTQAAAAPAAAPPAVDPNAEAMAMMAEQQRLMLQAMAEQQAAIAALAAGREPTPTPTAAPSAPMSSASSTPSSTGAAAGPTSSTELDQLRAQMAAQQAALEALQQQGTAQTQSSSTGASSTQRPVVVAPTSSAQNGSTTPDDPRVAELEAQLAATQAAVDERIKQLADEQWKMQYQMENGAAAPATPASGLTPEQLELAQLRAQLAQAQSPTQPVPVMPVPTLGAPAEDELRAEIEALRAELAAGTSEDTETAKMREMVNATEEDRLRMAELEQRLDEVASERTDLESQLASADAARAAELQTAQQAAEARAAQMQAELQRLQSRTEEMEQRYTTRYESLLAQLQPLIESGLNVRVAAGKIRVELPSDVLFASGSASLSRAGKGEVQEVAKALTPFRTLLVQVEGHTDSVPVKSFKYESNYDLAYARAKEVMSVLLEGGLPSDRVSAASFGDTRPVASNSDKEGRAKNRRIELDLELLPAE